MRTTVFALLLVMALAAPSALAVDGVVLINQSTLNAAGGTYTITQTGSYKLSGNLQAKDTNTTVIVVTADNVTIDLNGFTIVGTNSCGFFQPSTVTCVFTSAQIGIDGGFSSRLTISNGTINGMGQYGISAEGPGSRIDSVTVANNGSGGMLLGSGLVDKCRVLSNGGDGIGANSDGGSVQKSFFDGNKLLGLNLTPGWGYSQNNLQNNNGIFGAQVQGGVNLGQNQCRNVVCPP